MDRQLQYKAYNIIRFFKWLYYPDIDDPKRRNELSSMRENLIV